MNTLRKVNKSFVLFVALSLAFSLALPLEQAYAVPFDDNPICTMTADNLNPVVSGSVTENFTVVFNSGLSSTTQHPWVIQLNPTPPAGSSQNYYPVPNSQVVNSTNFPSGMAPYGDSALLSQATVSESALSGNTYTISATWNASTEVNGAQWLPQFSTNDNDNEGCQMSTLITFRALNAGAISANPNPAQVNTSVSASASFSDPNTSNTHTATWGWGDGNTSNGTVTESNGSGTVSDSHTYTQAGVYTITLTVTGSDGSTATSTYQYLSVYDPTPQGLFSAGHKFTSPAGAYPQNSSLTGNVTFGLVYKYQGSVPTSEREFMMNFGAANLTFNATTISTLVISNGMATLTGTGTINGSGSYNFLVTGVNSGGIRIQITDPSNNNNVIYDTQPGASATATPTTSVNGMVIVNS